MRTLASVFPLSVLLISLCCTCPLKAQVSWPLNRFIPTSAFGLRIHPITKIWQFHSGTDLRAHYEPVMSVMAGMVSDSGENSILGKYVKINHRGIESIYAHLSKVFVIPSEQVHSGQVLGISGNSGRSTAPHLHLSIKLAGKFIDPVRTLEILKTTNQNNLMENLAPIQNDELPLAVLLSLLNHHSSISLSPLQAKQYGVEVADQLPTEEEANDGK